MKRPTLTMTPIRIRKARESALTGGTAHSGDGANRALERRPWSRVDAGLRDDDAFAHVRFRRIRFAGCL